jgi:hypothetical protein
MKYRASHDVKYSAAPNVIVTLPPDEIMDEKTLPENLEEFLSIIS